MPLTITDSFNRADNASTLGSTDTGQVWQSIDTWGIESNKARAFSVTSGYGPALVDLGEWASGAYVEFDMTWAASAAVVVGFLDINNFELLQFQGDQQLVHYRKTAGVFSTQSSTNLFGTPHHLNAGQVYVVRVRGTSAIAFTLSINGVDVRNGDIAHGGTLVGFAVDTVNAARFDDFEAYSPLAGITTRPRLRGGQTIVGELRGGQRWN